MRYLLNSPDAIQETVDGEVLIIHTPSGSYFSLVDTAERVWNALLAGYTPAEIAATYQGDAPLDVTAAVEDFVQQLLEEQLLVPGHPVAASEALPAAAQPFSPPAFQKFTDMQELLLVDPIHEVDRHVGWPRRHDAG